MHLEGSLSHIQRHQATRKHQGLAKSIFGLVPVDQKISEASKTTKKIEDQIVMFAVEHNISFNTVDHLTKLIKFSIHHKAVASVKFGRIKATQMVINSFRPRQQGELAANLRKSLFSMILDESTDVSSKKSLAVTVRFHDGHKVISLFLCLLECPDATADALFDLLLNKFKELDIPLRNIIGYGADNANIMMGSKSGLIAKITSVLPKIFVMCCICHRLDLCSSSAAAKLPKYVEQFVHDVYNHFAHSAKRKHTYARYQELCEVHAHAILRPCNTRWLSLKVCFYSPALLYSA